MERRQPVLVTAIGIGPAFRLFLLPDAIALAKTLAKLEKARVIMYRRPYGYGGSIYASAIDPQRDLPGGARGFAFSHWVMERVSLLDILLFMQVQ